MKKRFEGAIQISVALAMLTASMTAMAQSKGTWSLKVGLNKITPQVSSGDMSAPALPGTKAEVGSDTQPVFVGSYMLTDHISAELDLGLPYKHDLLGAGAIQGTGKLGSAEALPPTAFLQYRFQEANAKFRPYVGLGLTYAYFQKETGSGALTAITDPGGSSPTTYRLDNRFALTTQVGITYAINEKWFADVTVAKTFLKTTSHFSTGQTLDIRLDPVAVSLAVGYHF